MKKARHVDASYDDAQGDEVFLHGLSDLAGKAVRLTVLVRNLPLYVL